MSSLSLLDVALRYHAAGRSVFPVAPGTKWPSRPGISGPDDIPWKRQYGRQPADTAQLTAWFGTETLQGLSIACGLTSGVWTDGAEYGLEVIDIDDPALFDAFGDACRCHGLDAVLSRLVIERTPGGAGHLGYLCTEIAGNQKLAQGLGPDGKPVTLIETRGEGGQIVAAPTPPGIHPECPERGYVLVQGDWADVPRLTPEERTALLTVARSLNTYVPTKQVMTGPRPKGRPSSDPLARPGDKLNALADPAWWAQLLEAHGWVCLRQRGDIQYWQRPGKEDGGLSATLGACGPYFYVFSSNAAPFEPDAAYTPFAAYTLLEHGSDWEASAKALAAQYRGVYVVEAPVNGQAIPDLSASLGWEAQPVPSSRRVQHAALEIPGLMYPSGKNTKPYANYENICLGLEWHPEWQGKLWWDDARCWAMCDTTKIEDDFVIELSRWFGRVMEININGKSSKGVLEDCVYHICRKDTRDPLQTWLHSLPPWDRITRLDTWLPRVLGIPEGTYACLVSRQLILAMIARAVDPGCVSREVVIFQGKEAIGKSELVLALAGEEWHTVLQMNLDSKESHMALQGTWVAEFAELESWGRTEVNRLKGFITMRKDEWIPKFSNMRITRKRRTVFIGTTNEESIFREQTGNTRYLPIHCGPRIDLPLLRQHREQLFAEALYVYQSSPDTWWHRSAEEDSEAVRERNERRQASIYEDDLHYWLTQERFDLFARNAHWVSPRPNITTWREIAIGFLRLDTPEKWGNLVLQKQIATALRGLGWKDDREYSPDGKRQRCWTFGTEGDTTEVPF